jgi:hypothetical protein
MATRSRIGIMNDDGSVLSIYCHWDGYLSNNGKILLEHYTDEAKIRELMALGDISSLGAEIGEKHPFDSPGFGNAAADEYRQLYGHMCNAYGRDRGENNIAAKLSRNITQFAELEEEFNYLFAEGQWTVSFWNRPRMLLSDAITVNADSDGH